MVKINVEKNKTINVGIELLRSLLCLWVLFSHCSIIKKKHIKYFYRSFHVPTFLVLSFYFYYSILCKRTITKIKERFLRLLFPYIAWSLFTFIINNILVKYTLFGKNGIKLSLKDLYLQILTGSKYYRVFWFQFNLIFLSLLFTINAFILKEKNIIALELLGIISLYSLFSEINKKLFSPHKIHMQMSIGRLNASIPLAVMGCYYRSLNLLIKVNDLNWNFYVILLSLIYILFKYDLFVEYPGFDYSNTLLYLSASTVLFVIFGAVKFERFNRINKAFLIITKYTGGIYYIHQIFPKYLFFFMKLNRVSYFSSIKIYIICYFFCFIGNKLFFNYKKIYNNFCDFEDNKNYNLINRSINKYH